jgi:hypothetical protein
MEHQLLKSCSEKHNTLKDKHRGEVSFSLSWSTDNSAENLLPIVSICETNSSSKSAIDSCQDRTYNHSITSSMPSLLVLIYLDFLEKYANKIHEKCVVRLF